MTKGIFISIEGTDGSGKSTQIELLKEYLAAKKVDSIFLREPGGTEISEKIRDIILDVGNKGMSATTEMLLYAAARAQLMHEVILPGLSEGKTVVCDRFVDSSYAYQSFARGLGIDAVRDANRHAIAGVMPQMTLFFDISPQEALARRLSATSADRLELEPEQFHIDVYNGYKVLAASEPERIKVIDARRSIDEVATEVRALIDGLLEMK
ncbi:MAG: dTMP kinase [Bacillota bacterium]